MAVLAVIAVLIAVMDIAGKLPPIQWIVFVENAIWLIFVADYIFRFVRAKEKKRFVKENIFDLIAILPFSAFLRVFRVARLLRLTKLARVAKATKLVKLFAFAARFGTKAKHILKTNGLIYVLYVNAGVVLLGAIGIYFLEGGTTVHNFSDAVWWSFVTTTTVGYGDITPASGYGRIIAVILMLTGIGTIGMLTSSLSTFFLSGNAEKSEKSVDNEDLHKAIDSLTPKQSDLIRDVISNLKD